MANRELTPWRMPGMQTFGRDPFSSFRREMDRLFEDFFAPTEGRSFAPAARAEAGMIMPSIDVQENEKAYTLTAELPGIDLKDIELRLDDNVLTLRGEKRSERHEEESGRRYSERSYGRFERSIPFAAEVDPEHIEASCDNGVLKVMLPKNAKARETSRRIEIRGAGKPHAGAGQTAAGQAKPTAGT
jgi:HSP20 family protein